MHAEVGHAIGPNALLQPVAVLRARLGEERARRILEASTGRTLDRLPDAMVDETEVARFHRGVVDSLGWEAGLPVLREAGLRTGDYLLAHRIPKPAQFVLKLLPARMALGLLAKAMSKHAWTFAGSGTFHYASGANPVFEIAHCPLCRGVQAPSAACDFYAGTFERLVKVLVDPGADVTETSCEAHGGSACRFTVRLS